MDGTLRFSDDGPEFPGDFVDSLLAGDVIFLCGTSVSAPQMPDFPPLMPASSCVISTQRLEIDGLLAGDVIFLCGTSVSAPQMPDFPQLVESTYPRLAIERTDSEQFSFDQGRLEEVLGSLNRRLSDPDELTRGAF